MQLCIFFFNKFCTKIVNHLVVCCAFAGLPPKTIFSRENPWIYLFFILFFLCVYIFHGVLGQELSNNYLLRINKVVLYWIKLLVLWPLWTILSTTNVANIPECVQKRKTNPQMKRKIDRVVEKELEPDRLMKLLTKWANYGAKQPYLNQRNRRWSDVNILCYNSKTHNFYHTYCPIW